LFNIDPKKPIIVVTATLGVIIVLLSLLIVYDSLFVPFHQWESFKDGFQVAVISVLLPMFLALVTVVLTYIFGKPLVAALARRLSGDRDYGVQNMLQEICVCKDNQWHVKPGEKFMWKNDANQPCKIAEDTGHPNTWPFASPSYAVLPNQPCPGQAKTHLPPGTYWYDVDCCDKKTMPKNVLVP
jgi:hypothetical protein